MRLYFQAGRTHRLAIDTDKKTWNDNFCYLGGHKQYIKISVSDYIELLKEIDFHCYDYNEKF